jgi:hypothetical protein
MKYQTHFWKGTTQGSFQQILVEIGSVVSEEKIVSSPQKPLGQLLPNFGGIVLGWSPSKIVSGDPDFQPRWPPR